MTTNPKDTVDVVRYPDARCGHVLDRPEPDLEMKMKLTTENQTPQPIKCPCIGRNGEWPKSLLFYFDRVPTDDQMRYLHEVVQRACACMPEDLL